MRVGLSCKGALRQREHCIVSPVDKRAGQWEKRGVYTRCARRMGVEPGPPHTHLYMALLPITTSTRLYLRVVKLDPKLSSRLRERLVTFEHSLSVIQVYTQRNKQRERVRPVGVSTEERRAGPREE